MDIESSSVATVRPSPAGAARSHVVEWGFLVLALGTLAIGYRAPAVRTLSLLFSSIILEALPFMLLGALVGGLVETFVSRERIASLLPRREWLAVLLAGGLGVAFPVCECAVVPVVRRLARKGVPAPAVVAYLLGAPIANPIVAASTAVAYRFDWRVVGTRFVVGYGIAVTTGFIVGRLFRRRAIFVDAVQHPASHGPCGCDAAEGHGCHHAQHHEGNAGHGHGSGSLVDRIGESLRHAADDFLGVGQYFVIGAFVAALAQTFIDRTLFLGVSHEPVAAIVAMMALAVAINLCSEADAFVASSFRGLMPMSAQMAFLLLGPILDLKLLLMYQTLFRRRVIVHLAVVMVVLVLVAALGLHASGRFA